MALTVENGTGIAGADSFVTLAEIATFASSRGLAWPNGAGPDQQEQAARLGADYLRNEHRFPYKGTRRTSSQTLPYPRTGASETGGLSIGSTEIPWRIKEAQCRLAVRIIATLPSLGQLLDLQPDLARGGRIQTSTVDVITTTYFEDAPSETQLTDVMGILAPLLKKSKAEDPLISFQSEAPASPFLPDEFNYP